MGDFDYIFERRHPKIKDKEAIWKLISDSYIGGWEFLKNAHLFKYPRENSREYDARKRRSTYFNYVQPCADILTGLLYTKKVCRKYPPAIESLIDGSSTEDKKTEYEAFIQAAAIHALLYPCGVLVDTPNFNAADVITEADRQALDLQPYMVLYRPWQIRDFYVNHDCELEWILLDDTFIDASNAFTPSKKTLRYTLWTKTECSKFEKTETSKAVVKTEEITHNIGEVPFVFMNWKDIDQEEELGETPFEDIALNGRMIYNYMSLMDEMIHSGTFKAFFYPLSGGAELPKELHDPNHPTKGGIGNLSIIPFDGTLTQKPFFDGPSLSEMAPFLSSIDMYRKEILSKVGLDKDVEKNYAQSGIAKSLEYRKTHAILTIAAETLEDAEEHILKLFCLWMGIDSSEVDVEYPKEFDPNDTKERVEELLSVIQTLEFPSVKLAAAKEIVEILFSRMDSENLKMLLMAMDQEKPSGQPGTLSDAIQKIIGDNHKDGVSNDQTNPTTGNAA